MADWLRHTFGVRAQLRMGVLMVVGSIPLMIWGFWVDEPFLIYQMSAGALLFSGIGVVVTAETLEEVAQDVGEATEAHRCERCGQPLPASTSAPA